MSLGQQPWNRKLHEIPRFLVGGVKDKSNEKETANPKIYRVVLIVAADDSIGLRFIIQFVSMGAPKRWKEYLVRSCVQHSKLKRNIWLILSSLAIFDPSPRTCRRLGFVYCTQCQDLLFNFVLARTEGGGQPVRPANFLFNQSL